MLPRTTTTPVEKHRKGEGRHGQTGKGAAAITNWVNRRGRCVRGSSRTVKHRYVLEQCLWVDGRGTTEVTCRYRQSARATRKKFVTNIFNQRLARQIGPIDGISRVQNLRQSSRRRKAHACASASETGGDGSRCEGANRKDERKVEVTRKETRKCARAVTLGGRNGNDGGTGVYGESAHEPTSTSSVERT